MLLLLMFVLPCIGTTNIAKYPEITKLNLKYAICRPPPPFFGRQIQFLDIITTILIFIAIFADNRYHCMYYEYNQESIDDILKVMAANAKKRRLEKGWTRKYLCERSDVPVSTIAKFESLHTISLASYVAIAKALGYSSDVKKLMSEAIFTTMKELDTINNNKNRKRGQRENHK